MTGLESKARILIVDDDPQIRQLHARLAQSLGYDTETAADGIEALAKLALGIDLVMLDGQMPKMDGFEVAERIRALPGFAFLPIIMVTGLEGDVEHRRAFQAGINDFVQKPIDRDVFHLRTHWLLDLKRAHDRLNHRSEELERAVEKRTAALRDALHEMTEARRQIHQAHLDTIRRLTIAAEFKDRDTGEHIERIGRYAQVLADGFGLSPGAVEIVRHAAPLHDVGKLGIPDEVLLKPGKLDAAEWAVMRTHAELGARILSDSESPVIQMGQTIARSHHERWDGSGYPNGIAGEAIPIEARICAIVDVFDALTMDRPYRRAVDPETVLEMMKKDSGSHFDPQLLDAFFARLPDMHAIRTQRNRGETEQPGARSPH
jgi:putative two-component system response regulator